MDLITDGIIFRQVKATGGRRMILLFTKKYGKISVGTSLSEKGKNRASLALRPFTFGSYQIYQGRNYYNLDRAETVKSFYGIGEDPDKYMSASYVLELTERVVPEEVPQPQIFQLLVTFMEELSERPKKPETLVLAYEVKLLRALGVLPAFHGCERCGAQEELTSFSIPDAGMLCRSCRKKIPPGQQDALIYDVNFGIVDIIQYFADKPLSGFRGIALEPQTAQQLQKILRDYFSYHLDVGELKSEQLLLGQY